MNGIINVLKPAGMTSFDVVGYLRKVAGQKKIGHTGTLDPSAVGVLPICLGNATGAIEFMMEKDKVYRAELTLGYATDTQDASGNVIYTGSVEPDHAAIEAAIGSFTGELEQLPPMYSAIKINGRKLYELARKGETVERQPRKIRVFDIKILRIWEQPDEFGHDREHSGRLPGKMLKKALFEVHCSKGTYIRTLCHDIGEKLGCGGHMSFLVRTRAGRYGLDTALTLEEIRELSDRRRLEESLIPVETVFEDFDSIRLDERETFKYSNGVWLQLDVLNGKSDDSSPYIRVYDNMGTFLGIGEMFGSPRGTCLKSRKFFTN
ncbi:tRNA pseudouridine synthase B [Ruminiclostridium hungatei]|uniref:tRNA pseudouridine synthase B n=1 Tax=Ruminiclostridium hungatei TaxID=48256 RepID=A0A1V4SS04_RUMHU|nr:tRNA pseudouridine(55) synthase TruB [Ruminiclostridium hungatei]OPX46225.1 tRNA pseudouridine synthase B [Ruminiclostridium hungatei]